jgi:hypothetical protein
MASPAPWHPRRSSLPLSKSAAANGHNGVASSLDHSRRDNCSPRRRLPCDEAGVSHGIDDRTPRRPGRDDLAGVAVRQRSYEQRLAKHRALSLARWGCVRQPCCWCDTASWPSPPGSDHHARPVRCGGGFSSVEKADGGDNVKLMLIGRHTRQHPPRVPELPLRGSGSVGRNWPEAADSQLRLGRLRARTRRVSAHASDALAPGAKLGVRLSERLSGAGAVPAVRAVRAPGWRRARRGGVGAVVRRCVALRRCCPAW